MQFDFTIDTYLKLLAKFEEKGYQFQSFSDYLKSPQQKVVILRNDVDKLPENSLRFARIQSNLGIKGSYYFRSVRESWDEGIIKEISNLGHEIGYHYENLAVAAKLALSHKHKNNSSDILDLALLDFKNQLNRLRGIVPVETICMHGSPTSIYDSKDLWKKFNYSAFGIIGEPYFDIDFSRVFYLTDTGRCWNGFSVSVRDKIKKYQKIWNANGMVYKSSFSIIKALDNNKLPNQIMMTFHPQRWNDLNYAWCKELIFQTLKNPLKKGLIRFRKI
ncbi:hypothetical protein [Marinifilum fragile]|uniref:hypothetical protein n=1 Tax=Marinifilum fragile TaxID=570161 RepID=UPI002AA907E9|nr:hypothetical protein [Marinifilum fragile]